MLMRALKLYVDMGWPMDFQRTRLLVSEAATRMRGVDRKFGHLFVCSNLCVKDSVHNSRKKISDIDPLRAKKAATKEAAD